MGILVNLPKSELKDVFKEKYNGQEKRYEILISELTNICDYISKELIHINELFSEYTPHDKDYHITNLFRISDILLGRERYEKMNLMELYLLVVSMYAHDWGMAVSKTERKYIATKKLEKDVGEINLLDDEFVRFEEFVNSKMGKVTFNDDEEIRIEIWQEYIRNTHALRSGKRIEKYYEDTNGSIASALSKICVGHWLDIKDISERNGYYKDTPVFGENVNLNALTIYIRLIDLFDLAEDRTPYVIWKYVNPQNAYSKMEWKKHRALHQITCPNYESGRVICISGSTDNHEVYAALMDLKCLCERYFRECSDALAHMNDKRHELGVFFLDWKIEARNFKPVTIAFDFEKDNIFRTLSDEIYDSHPYVYIRELVQNSVDAITLRKEILNRKRIGGNNIGQIHLEVKETSDEDIEIVCQDDGIGMDEYVLKNYFAVLGKSYYSSNEFKNKRLKMSPISRFGIGILSCFSVADEMEIYTKREPYMEEGSDGLKVIISDIRRQFRVEKLPDYKCDVGTTIKLKVKKDCLQEHLVKNKIKKYSISEYIKQVTDFVQYPIVIREYDKKIIIIPDNYDMSHLKEYLPDFDEFDIWGNNSNYPVEDRVVVQDVEDFNKIFKIRKLDLSEDLKMDNVEGTISFAILKDYNNNIFNLTRCWPTNEIQVHTNGKKYRIRWNNVNRSYDTIKIVQNYLRMYNKGFLLERDYRMINEISIGLRSDIFPAPHLRINFINTLDSISVSRFERKEENEILKDIWKKMTNYLLQEWKEISNELEKFDYWKALSIFLLQYRIDIAMIEEDIFSGVEFPFINKEGIEFKNIFEMDKISFLPNKKCGVADLFCNNKMNKFDKEKWTYGECILISGVDKKHFWDSTNKYMRTYMYEIFKLKYSLESVRFVYGEEFNHPIEQEIWSKTKKEWMQYISDVLKGIDLEWSENNEKIKRVYDGGVFGNKFVPFHVENNQYLAYGCKKININHPLAQNLIIYTALLDELKNDKTVNTIELAEMNDKLRDLPFFDREIRENWDEQYLYEDINESIVKVHEWLQQYYGKILNKVVTISENDFLPKSIEIVNEKCFKKVEFVEIRG